MTLTLSRLLLLIAFLTLIPAGLSRRRLRVLLSPLPLALIISLTLTAIVVWSSAYTNGCNCGGVPAGITEFAATGILAVCLMAWDPWWRRPLLIAAGCGTLVAAAIAVPDVFTGGGARLLGNYGNPNNLGFAVGLGIPILLTLTLERRRPWIRILLAAATVLLAVITYLSYSRGALVAVGCGILALAFFRVSAPRLRTAVGPFAVVCVAAGVVLYPSFSSSRLQADVSANALNRTLALRRGVWDPAPTGLIRTSRIAHLMPLSGGGLRVLAPAPGGGASLGLGPARPNLTYTASVSGRAVGHPLMIVVALEDNFSGLGPAARRFAVGTRARRLAVSWRPLAYSFAPRLYVWAPAGGDFVISRASLLIRPGPLRAQRLSTRAITSQTLLHLAAAKETYDINFRKRMLSLAWQAFLAHPIRGLGLGEFPPYVASRTNYGRESAQSEYGGFLAELGILGAFVLLAIAVCAALGLRRPFPLRPAVAGVLVTALVGLAFASALETLTISAVIAVSLAEACTRPAAAGELSGGLRVPPEDEFIAA